MCCQHFVNNLVSVSNIYKSVRACVLIKYTLYKKKKILKLVILWLFQTQINYGSTELAFSFTFSAVRAR